MMKILHSALGIIFAFALMFTLLITSVEAVTYWTPGYYENEYEKYDVLDDVHMEMDDLLDVTHEMMAYLRGNRADLHVPTIVNGQPREFFNEREIAHMEDVRGLFLGAIDGGLPCTSLCIKGKCAQGTSSDSLCRNYFVFHRSGSPRRYHLHRF